MAEILGESTFGQFLQICLQINSRYIRISAQGYHNDLEAVCSISSSWSRQQNVLRNESRSAFCTLVDTCFSSLSYKLLLHMVFIADRIKWWHMLQKHMVCFMIQRTSVFDIINHRPAYCIRYW